MRSQSWHIRHAVALLLIPLAACSDVPRDPDATLDKIETRHEFRVGIAGTLPPEALRLISTIERRTHATARISDGALEPMLAGIDEGSLDLVIAPFRKDSPLAAPNALSPPVRTIGSGKTATEWRAAMKNGENRWIMLVETSARAVAPPE